MPSQFDSFVTTALVISVVFLVIRMVPWLLSSVSERIQEKSNPLVELYEWYTEKLSLPWQLIIGFMAFNLIVGLAGVDGSNPYNNGSKPMGWMVENERNKQEFIKEHVDVLGHGDKKKKNKKEEKTKAS